MAGSADSVRPPVLVVLGSLTLWMAEHYPRAKVCAVSNSGSQREYIERQCAVRGLHNVRVITADVNRLVLPAARFDR